MFPSLSFLAVLHWCFWNSVLSFCPVHLQQPGPPTFTPLRKSFSSRERHLGLLGNNGLQFCNCIFFLFQLLPTFTPVPNENVVKAFRVCEKRVRWFWKRSAHICFRGGLVRLQGSRGHLEGRTSKSLLGFPAVCNSVLSAPGWSARHCASRQTHLEETWLECDL